MSVLGHEEHARRNREALDAKVRELRAAGWDVVARRERDKALNERDDATDALAGAVAENERLRQAVMLARERLDALPISPRLIIARDALDAALDGGQ